MTRATRIGILYLWASGLSAGMLLHARWLHWFTYFLIFQTIALGYLGYWRVRAGGAR